MENTLQLNLHRRWFDLIASGAKKEEYRALKYHWAIRLIDVSNYQAESKDDYKVIVPNIMYDIDVNLHDPMEVIQSYYSSLKHFDTITFRNGYSKTAPIMVVECKGITVGSCRPEWSDNAQGDHFVIHLGKIISNTQTT